MSSTAGAKEVRRSHTTQNLVVGKMDGSFHTSAGPLALPDIHTIARTSVGPSYGRHEGISAAGVLRARRVRPVGRHPPAAATSKRGHGCQGVWHCSQALPLRHGHHSGSRLPAPRVSCLRLGLTCRMALPVPMRGCAAGHARLPPGPPRPPTSAATAAAAACLLQAHPAAPHQPGTEGSAQAVGLAQREWWVVLAGRACQEKRGCRRGAGLSSVASAAVGRAVPAIVALLPWRRSGCRQATGNLCCCPAPHRLL